MTVAVSRHVFGTRGGYRTLAASPDLSIVETRELEVFSFGQTGDTEYLASLTTVPAYFSRPLSTGRRAITRILAGPRDDQGRDSLLLITAVLSASDWLTGVSGRESEFLSDATIWQWNGASAPPPLQFRPSQRPRRRPSSEQRRKALSLLSALEAQQLSGDIVLLIDEQALTSNDLDLVASLLPRRLRIRFAYARRSLSDGLPAHANVTCPVASRGKSRRQTMIWSPGIDYGFWEYSAGLAHFWKPGHEPPWDFVDGCNAFGTPWQGPILDSMRVSVADDVAPSDSQVPVEPPSFAWLYWTVALLLLAAIAVAAWLARSPSTPSSPQTLAGEIEAFLNSHDDPDRAWNAAMCVPGAELDQARELQRQLRNLPEEGMPEQLEKAGSQLADWCTEIAERCELCAGLDQVLRGFDAVKSELGFADQAHPDLEQALQNIENLKQWKQTAEDAREIADNVQDRRLSDVGQLITDVDKVLAIRGKIDTFRGELDKVCSSFEAPFPSQLSDAFLEEWQRHEQELSRLKDVAQTQYLDADTEAHLDKCRDKHDRWAEKIKEIEECLNEHLEKASKEIAQANLRSKPVASANLRFQWNCAEKAAKHIDDALKLHTDHGQANELHTKVTTWQELAVAPTEQYIEGELYNVRERRLGDLLKSDTSPQPEECEQARQELAGVARLFDLVVARSTQLTSTYETKLDALECEWSRYCELSEVRAFFHDSPPTLLRDQVVKQARQHTKRLMDVCEAPACRKDDPFNIGTKLEESCESCRHRADLWNRAILRLEQDLAQAVEMARTAIDQYGLHGTPDPTMNLPTQLRLAAGAETQLRRALRISPDDPEANSLLANLLQWMQKARRSLILNVEWRLNTAQAALRDCDRRSGNSDELCQDALTSARDAVSYWNDCRAIIETEDRTRAKELGRLARAIEQQRRQLDR